MKCIDLYAGIGGFRLGLEGQDFIWSNEWDRYARSVYRYHFGDIDGRDITTVPVSDIPDADLWTFGSPCQDFSVAGARKGIEGSRGNLTLYTLDLLEVKKPRYFLMENVPGLLSIGGRQAFSYIIGRFVEMGYSVEWLCLNSRHFGVPQNRERLFVVGHLGGEPRPEVFSFGEGNNQLDGSDKNYAYAIDSCIGKGPRGSGRRTMIQAGNIYGDYNPTEGRIYDPVAGSPSLATPTGGHQIPLIQSQATSGIRRLTPLECERLQGFPDNWTAKGIDDDGNEVEISDTQRYRQCGNAVTVNVIRHFGRVFEALSKNTQDVE